MKSVLRWQGGKGRLAMHIVGRMPPHGAYVETCCGGAAVFWAKPLAWSLSEILNDADGELVNFYYMLHKRGKRLAGHVDAMPYSRAWFARTLAARPRGAFARAARFWYLNRVAFGGRRDRPTFGVSASRRPYVLPAAILANLDATIQRLRGVSFEAVDLVRLVELYDRPDTLFYVDPPYWGLSQDYACRFALDDHIRLRAALGRLRGTWLLSYNDCLDVRRLYARCHVQPLTTRYTMGCNSRSKRVCPPIIQGIKSPTDGAAAELLISNRPLVVHRTMPATPRPGIPQNADAPSRGK